MNNKVSVGITSIIGWLSALAALMPAIIKALETGEAAFNGPEKYLAIFGIASGLITQIARYLQAHKLIGISSSAQIGAGNLNFIYPSEFEAGTPNTIIRPESAVTPDGPGSIVTAVSNAPSVPISVPAE